MLSMTLLSGFNILVLLAPPEAVASVLTLMNLPLGVRYMLLLAACVNIVASMGFEKWGTSGVSVVIGWIFSWWGRRRVRDGKTYKAVEGGMH